MLEKVNVYKQANNEASMFTTKYEDITWIGIRLGRIKFSGLNFFVGMRLK